MSLSAPPLTPGVSSGQPRRAAIIFILVTVVLDVLALGIIIPILPKLVQQFEGGDTAKAAETIGLFGVAWALMQFVFSPILGALSDRYGRRPIILLSNVGLGLDYVLMAMAPNLIWLFVGRVLSGICAASFATATAYIADITAPEKRAERFGLIFAAFGIGFVLGPALGGVLGEIDARLPFWAAAILSLANAAYGYFILPESLPRERRDRFRWRKANPVGSLRLLNSVPGLSTLGVISFLVQLSHVALPSVFVLYASYRYGWSASDVGLSLALIGISSAAVQALLVKRTIKHFGEPAALFIGIGLGMLGFALYGLAPTGIAFLCGIPLMALWGIGTAALQGLMSRMVDERAQGQLQGANTALMGLAGMIGPFLFTYLFAWAIAYERQAVMGDPSIGLVARSWAWLQIQLPALPPLHHGAGTGLLTGAPFYLSAALLLVASVLALEGVRKARAVATLKAKSAASAEAAVDPQPL